MSAGATPSPRVELALAMEARRLASGEDGRALLARLAGDWDMEGSWEIAAGAPPLPLRGSATGTVLLAGTALQWDGFGPDGEHTSRVLVAFDPSARDYVAFSTATLATHYELERGSYDAATDTLAFVAVEVLAGGRRIGYRRAVVFEDGGSVAVSITHPDEPPGTVGRLDQRFTRRGAP